MGPDPRSGDIVVCGSAKGIILRPEGNGAVRLQWERPEKRQEVIDGTKLVRLPNGNWRLSTRVD